MISLVIFDLDGTLADTETLHSQAYREALRAQGVLLSEEEYAENWIRAGLGLEQFLAQRGLTLDPMPVRRLKGMIYDDLLATSLRPMPGAVDLLARLHAHKRLAVATSSTHDGAERVLQELGLAGHFELMAAREDVENPKPAPDIFLYVAQCLAVVPSECVVVEDAEKGIVAAQRAGMRSIAVPNRLTRSNDFSAATAVAGSLPEVEHLLEQLSQ